LQLRKQDEELWEVNMQLNRGAFAAIVLTAGLWATQPFSQIIDLAKYPDWAGQWNRVPDGGPPRYDPSKPLRKQEAPMKPEYQALHEASLRDLDAGGFGLDTHYACMPMGMPRQMSGVSFMEFLFSPSVTHILFELTTAHTRRIYTDGRDFPVLVQIEVCVDGSPYGIHTRLSPCKTASTVKWLTAIANYQEIAIIRFFQHKFGAQKPTLGKILRLVDEHGVILMRVALTALETLKKSLTKCFFVFVVVKADAISLVPPLMKIEASHIGCLRKEPLEILGKRAIEAQHEHLFFWILRD
jgi:hypothetical protein